MHFKNICFFPQKEVFLRVLPFPTVGFKIYMFWLHDLHTPSVLQDEFFDQTLMIYILGFMIYILGSDFLSFLLFCFVPVLSLFSLLHLLPVLSSCFLHHFLFLPSCFALPSSASSFWRRKKEDKERNKTKRQQGEKARKWRKRKNDKEAREKRQRRKEREQKSKKKTRVVFICWLISFFWVFLLPNLFLKNTKPWKQNNCF